MPLVLRHDAYPVGRWRNGRGTAREIATGDGWQLRLADIEASGPFSEYAGVERWFAVTTGAVMLRLPSGEVRRCDPESAVARFAGAPGPGCELASGPPVRAVNLFLDAGRAGGRLGRYRIGPGDPSELRGRIDGADGADPLRRRSSPVAVVVQSGRVAFGDEILAAHDAIAFDEAAVSTGIGADAVAGVVAGGGAGAVADAAAVAAALGTLRTVDGATAVVLVASVAAK